MGEADAVVLALSFGLELMNRGALLVGSGGHPRLVNRAAREILKKRDGLWLDSGRLQTGRPADMRALMTLLSQVIACPGEGEPKQSPHIIPRQRARTALPVRVMPGPDLETWPGTAPGLALVTLQDPEQALNADEGILRTLYGLTHGEAVLASQLAQGRSLEQAAEVLFISGHTARTHLKRIFLKTDTHRQPELVVRLLTAAS